MTYRSYDDAEAEYEARLGGGIPDARNRGADHADVLSDGDAMTSLESERGVDFKRLMSKSRPAGTSGNGTKTRARKRAYVSKKAQWTPDEQIHSELRLVVWGLTVLERAFYAGRQHEARAVLTECARLVLRDRVGLTGAVFFSPGDSIIARSFGEPSPHRAGTDYEVRGLAPEVYDALKANPGAARVALVMHAHRVDPKRFEY